MLLMTRMDEWPVKHVDACRLDMHHIFLTNVESAETRDMLQYLCCRNA